MISLLEPFAWGRRLAIIYPLGEEPWIHFEICATVEILYTLLGLCTLLLHLLCTWLLSVQIHNSWFFLLDSEFCANSGCKKLKSCSISSKGQSDTTDAAAWRNYCNKQRVVFGGSSNQPTLLVCSPGIWWIFSFSTPMGTPSKVFPFHACAAPYILSVTYSCNSL
jgi:hypothetical protein